MILWSIWLATLWNRIPNLMEFGPILQRTWDTPMLWAPTGTMTWRGGSDLPSALNQRRSWAGIWTQASVDEIQHYPLPSIFFLPFMNVWKKRGFFFLILFFYSWIILVLENVQVPNAQIKKATFKKRQIKAPCLEKYLFVFLVHDIASLFLMLREWVRRAMSCGGRGPGDTFEKGLTNWGKPFHALTSTGIPLKSQIEAAATVSFLGQQPFWLSIKWTLSSLSH